jgi:hypothetical protein
LDKYEYLIQQNDELLEKRTLSVFTPLRPSEYELAKRREELRQKTDTIDLVKSAIMTPLRGGTVYGAVDWVSNASEPADNNFIKKVNEHSEELDKQL